MRTTDKSLLIETTSTIHGMLEQGGVCGKVIAYPLADAMRVTGMSAEDLADADDDDDCPGYDHVSIRAVIEHRLQGRVVRRGHVIE